MNSRLTRKFRLLFAELPPEIQLRARRAYLIWRDNPAHPGLNFKQVDPEQRIYSVRVGRDYRVLGILRGNTVIWYWIGKHDEYDRQLS